MSAVNPAIQPPAIRQRPDPTADAIAERKAKRFYIALVLFLFAIQITIMGSVMKLAIGDPSGAVVPNYHAASLNWDETRHLRETADRLGWNIQFTASDVADSQGQRALQMKIADAEGNAVDDLQVHGQLYHHAHADDVVMIEMKSTGDGSYFCLGPVRQAGLWQLDLAIDGGPEPMAKKLTFKIQED